MKVTEEVSTAILHELSAEGVLEVHARLATRVLDATMALVSLDCGDGDPVRAVARETPAGTLAPDSTLLTLFAARAAGAAEPIALRGIGDAADFAPSVEGEIAAVIAAPVQIPVRGVRGAIAVSRGGPHDWTDRDRSALEDLAASLAALVSARTRRLRTQREIEGLHDRLRRAERMAAIGRLAGGLAHDFNNLMTTVSSYTQMLLESPELDESVRADLREVAKAADRATKLASRLLNLSRRQMPEPRVVDLNAVIEGMRRMLQQAIGVDVELETCLGASVPRVEADPGQIEQVILNLVLNARDAMPDGGTVTVRTEERAVGAGGEGAPAAPLHLQPGRYAVLAVDDDGVGMDDATKARIFEPFFTTKEEGKGTGI
ncbi:MAG: sensor histidine kinase, partial [Gemmatimonadota bacterium]